MSSEDWTTPEIVRAVAALTAAVETLTDEVRGLDQRYVPREVIDSQRLITDQRILVAEKEIADLRATHRWVTRTLGSTVVGMAMTGALSAWAILGGGVV